MSGRRLEIIYALDAISHFDAWQVIFEFMIDQGMDLSAAVNFYDKQIALDKVNQNIKKSNRPNFKIECERNWGQCNNQILNNTLRKMYSKTKWYGKSVGAVMVVRCLWIYCVQPYLDAWVERGSSEELDN